MLQRLAENLYQRGPGEGGAVERPSSEEKEGFLRTLEALREEATAWSREAGAAGREAELWAQVLESIGPSARQQWIYDPASQEPPAEMLRLRDHQMGKNLVWLANRRYAGRKIVVWAATFHAARNLATIDVEYPKLREMYRAMAVMGEVAWRELGAEMYTLGFTASEGMHGTCFGEPPETLAAPSPGSLEDLLARAGLDSAVIDFRRPPPGGEWLRRPIASRPLGYLEMRADWTQVLDGMLYTRTMAPSTPAAAPQAAPGGGRR
jgi:erythromycin esterase-like protein